MSRQSFCCLIWRDAALLQLTCNRSLLFNPAMLPFLRCAFSTAVLLVIPSLAFAVEQPPAIKLELFAQGLQNPLHVWHDGTKRIFIEELIRHGRERQKKTGND